jgi:outer membrane lipoprotein SlyB
MGEVIEGDGQTMRIVKIMMVLASAAWLCGCVTRGINDINADDAGQASKVKFGTVIAAHPVNIRSDPNTGVGAGALLGGGAGAAIGNNSQSTVEGMLAGAIAGAIVQNALETGNGMEYTIAFGDGSTQILDQLQGPGDPVFKPGSAVMVEFGPTKHKILAADNLPETVAHPKEVRVEGAPKPSSIKVVSCTKTKSTDQERKVCSDQ